MPNPSTVESDDTPKPLESLEGYKVVQPRLVIIHDTDADGMSSAWCIQNGFKHHYSEVVLIPQRAGINTIPEGLLLEDEVYLVDRTYPWDTLLQLAELVFCVTVIDHHKSALDDYRNKTEVCADTETLILTASSIHFDYANITVLIDTNHAACMLCWRWSYERGCYSDTLEAPWFIQYIEDRDIWAWKLPNSKEINAGMHYLGHTFEQYDQYYMDYCEPSFYHNDLRCLGTIVLQTQLNTIKSIAHGPTVRCQVLDIKYVILPSNSDLFGKNTLKFAILCCPFTLISDLGSYMLNYSVIDSIVESGDNNKTAIPFEVPDVVLCYNEVEDGYIYSIRSKNDMVWLAKLHGGGGHPNASGFKSTVPPNQILD